MKQTAVEWLIEQMKDLQFINHVNAFNAYKLLYQAKKIEKENIVEAFKEGVAYWNGDEWQLIDIEEYYNNKFKKN
jgi:hypothetical protein